MRTDKTNGPQPRAACLEKPRNQSDCNDEIDESQPINPASLPAERSVLGALIEDDSFVPEVIASGLRCEHFFLSDHRRIFRAIELLHTRNAPVDYVSVAEQLGNRNEDFAAIADMIHGVVLHKGHILHHVKIIRQKARLRTLLRIGEWILKAVGETSDPDLIVAQIRNILDTCSEGPIRA
jgi:replicative DNA helicase